MRAAGGGQGVPGDPRGLAHARHRPGRSGADVPGEFRRAVATLVRLFGEIDLAEEAVQVAFAIAASAGRLPGSRLTLVAGS